ncbi:MAG: adenylyltransferase/cytidyltransferase family protein, partial [Candidatus Omnitrophota bacterium]
MKIGILGGSFNPPHIGHLILAQEALEAAGLDKVFFIPSNISPHKNNNLVDALKRFKMVQLMISGDKHFQALDVEI